MYQVADDDQGLIERCQVREVMPFWFRVVACRADRAAEGDAGCVQSNQGGGDGPKDKSPITGIYARESGRHLKPPAARNSEGMMHDGEREVARILRQDADESVHLTQHIRFVGLENIMIGIWNADDTRGRQAALNGFRLRFD